MAIDKKDLDNVLKLSDKEFKDKISHAIEAMGLEKKVSDKIMGDIGRVKKTIGSLTQTDIEKLTKNLDENKIQELQNIIKKENH